MIAVRGSALGVISRRNAAFACSALCRASSAGEYRPNFALNHCSRQLLVSAVVSLRPEAWGAVSSRRGAFARSALCRASSIGEYRPYFALNHCSRHVLSGCAKPAAANIALTKEIDIKRFISPAPIASGAPIASSLRRPVALAPVQRSCRIAKRRAFNSCGALTRATRPDSRLKGSSTRTKMAQMSQSREASAIV